MCGITGLVSDNNLIKKEKIIKLMNNAQQHRGPDAEGFYFDDGIAFGHLRLSIIDLSEIANQPMTDVSQRYTIVFNGEIYNYNDIKENISYPFITKGDTEVILAAYIKWGKDCLQYLNGMFAFAIWDKQESELFIARDRVGVKPFYYYLDENQFVFASEIRAILASGLVEPEISTNGLIDYLSYQSIHAPNTIVKNIFQLKGGNYGIYKDSTLEIYEYWHMLKPSKKYVYDSYEDAQIKLISRLKKSVELRMVSDVPVGVFLSGGVDSGLITALMNEQTAEKINSITIGFKEKKYDESKHAQLVANKFSTNHKNVTVSGDYLKNLLPEILSAFDSPSSDGPNTYLVSKIAKELNIKVVMSGLGGDELFAGYPVFKQLYYLLKYKFLHWIPNQLKKGLLGLNKNGRIKDKINTLFEKENTIEQLYPQFRRVISEERMGKILSKKLEKELKYNWIEQELFENKKLLKSFPILSQISFCEMVGYTQSVLLKDSDQMSMANSIELREPFFDFELIEMAMQVPDKFKPFNSPKKLLTDAIGDMLPIEITNKTKQTFTLPWEVWLKTDLKDFCDENIKFLQNFPELFDFQQIEGFWNSFLKNDDTILWSEIWSLVIISNWMKINKIKA
jgi:asparagine synthase (glutamine-hydrolysing)